MLAIKVGLVDLTGNVDKDTMAAAAAAINIQVTRDLPQFWPVDATVSYLPNPEAIPQGVWPVQLVDNLPPGEGGFHSTRHNQPFAKVVATPDSTEWITAASHETLEMLVDPSGNRLQTSNAINIVDGAVQDVVGRFEYLIELCDPCEADNFTYQIDGVAVSDFLTPHFYDPSPLPGTRYSFTGALTKPRQLLPGGYISWLDPQSDDMQQIVWLDPQGAPELRNLGPPPPGFTSLRAFVDSRTRELVEKKRVRPDAEFLTRRRDYRAVLKEAARSHARRYR